MGDEIRIPLLRGIRDDGDGIRTLPLHGISDKDRIPTHLLLEIIDKNAMIQIPHLPEIVMRPHQEKKGNNENELILMHLHQETKVARNPKKTLPLKKNPWIMISLQNHETGNRSGRRMRK